jgi:hypothetical protein
VTGWCAAPADAGLALSGGNRVSSVAIAVMGGGDQRLAEIAPRECGHVLVEYAPKVVKAPLAHKPHRRGPRPVGDVVEHPELVVIAER